MLIIPDNFTYDELTCKCGCGQMNFSQADLDRLGRLRAFFGKPMPIISGYRCPRHNANVSKTGTTGPHTVFAVDVRISHKRAYELQRCALMVDFTGIGVKQKGGDRFLHIDNLDPAKYPRPRIWSY